MVITWYALKRHFWRREKKDQLGPNWGRGEVIWAKFGSLGSSFLCHAVYSRNGVKFVVNSSIMGWLQGDKVVSWAPRLVLNIYWWGHTDWTEARLNLVMTRSWSAELDRVNVSYGFVGNILLKASLVMIMWTQIMYILSKCPCTKALKGSSYIT